MSQTFDPYHKWLGIPPKQQPPDHYRLLGLQQFEDDVDVIAQAADRQMAHLKMQSTGQYADLAQQLLNEVAKAQLCLLREDRRTAYDAQLRAQQQSTQPGRAMPAAQPAPIQAAPVQAAPIQTGQPLPAPQPAAPSPRPAAQAAPPGEQAGIAVIHSGSHRSPVHRARRRKNSTWVAPLLIAAAGAVVVAVVIMNAQTTPSRNASRKTSQENSSAKGQSATPDRQSSDTRPPRDRRRPPRHRDDNPRSLADVLARGDDPDQSGSEMFPPPGDTIQEPPTTDNDPPDPTPDLSAIRREPVPPEADQIKARRAVDQQYGSDRDAARTTNEKVMLAKRMYDAAVDTLDDPPRQFVLLQQAAELLVSTGEFGHSWQLLDDFAGRFELDVLPLKERALLAGSKKARRTQHFKVLADYWMKLATDARQQMQYQVARRALDHAATAAKRGQSPLLENWIDARSGRMQVIAARFEAIEPARRAAPTDPAAASQWGRFLCLYAEDWKTGLPLWILADDGPLLPMAQQDAQDPRSPADRLAIGEAWFAAVELAPDAAARRAVRARAYHWFQAARRDLTGLDRAKASQRMEDLAGELTEVPHDQWFEVLSLITLQHHTVSGEWTIEGRDIGNVSTSDDPRIWIPVRLPGNYDVQVELTRSPARSRKLTGLLLPVSSAQCAVVFGSKLSGISEIGGQTYPNNPTQTDRSLIDNRLTTITVHVDAKSDVATLATELDGAGHIQWQGPLEELSLADSLHLPESQVLGLRSSGTQTVFHSVRLRVRSGLAEFVVP